MQLMARSFKGGHYTTEDEREALHKEMAARLIAALEFHGVALAQRATIAAYLELRFNEACVPFRGVRPRRHQYGPDNVDLRLAAYVDHVERHGFEVPFEPGSEEAVDAEREYAERFTLAF